MQIPCGNMKQNEIWEEFEMNSICISGRLTAKPELKQTSNGVSVCTFDVAVQRPRKNDITDFIRCTAWRGTAEFVSKFFEKGQRIEVIGALTSRDWEDKNGNKRRDWEVDAELVMFGESKRENVSHMSPQMAAAQGFTTAAAQDFEEITGDDELPFE